MFTLAVAAMGRKVKAVDAAFVNHAYIRYVHVLSYKLDVLIKTLLYPGPVSICLQQPKMLISSTMASVTSMRHSILT